MRKNKQDYIIVDDTSDQINDQSKLDELQKQFEDVFPKVHPWNDIEVIFERLPRKIKKKLNKKK